VNGTDVTQAASDGNWEEVGKYFKLPAGESFDNGKYIFEPTNDIVEHSAEQNAKELERWTSGPGTFFDWVRKEGYSIDNGVLRVTPKSESE
jgi:hypothetical protein